jgi:hypothetical protein
VSLLGPKYYERHKLANWNVQPSVLLAKDARLTRRVFPELSKADHLRLAEEYAKKAGEARRSYYKALDAAIKKYGDVKGPYVSGIYNPDFPETVKNRLRNLASAPGELSDASVAHWVAAGKRTPWRDSPLQAMSGVR